MNIQTQIEELYARETKEFGEEYFQAFDELKAGLNEGTIRAAKPSWRVILWSGCQKAQRGQA